MADAVDTQTLYEGDKRLIQKFVSVSDGTGEAAVVKVDVSALTPSPKFGAPTEVIINRIDYDVRGMSVKLLWDASADVAIAVLEGHDFIDATPYGGMRNNAGTGVTGDILFTTVDHTNLDTYTIILDMTKHYK